jgi:hypothetical protein
MTQSSEQAARNAERRRNPHLREMVDELLATIRVAANRDLWSTEERAQCEADMARIMENVRQQALGGRRV